MRKAALRVALPCVALLVLACSGAAPPTQIPVHPPGASQPAATGGPESFPLGQPYSEAEFWAGVVPGGDNVEHYASLAEMARAADAVVVGAVDSIGTDPARYKSVDLQGAMFATLSVKVERVVAGSIKTVAPGTIDVAIFMTDPRQYDRFAARLPTGRALLFLRNSLVEAVDAGQPTLPGDDHYYRVVSDQGLLLDAAGGTYSAAATDPFLQELTNKPFDKVIALVSSLAP